MTTTTPRSSRSARLALVAAVGLASLTVAACGSDAATDTTGGTDTTVGAITELTFTGQWARTSPAGASMGAAYVTITSPVDDALIGVSIDTAIAADGAELHEMVMADGGSMSDTTMAMGSETTAGGMGEMTMQPVGRIELPAGTPVALAPGGYHIMLLGLVKPLEAGTTIQITFMFENAGSVTVDVPVLDDAPMP